MKQQGSKHASSFRDPSGFIFNLDGTIYRQINQSYREDYDHLLSSGLYKSLVESHLLVDHREAEISPPDSEAAYKIIRPTPVAFISYPYEWCFSALRQAALATLAIQDLALDHGMILKDASAYNIQFSRGKPLLIDTLSFQRMDEGRPWDGYRQFCQHFLAPLSLMAYRDVRLSKLLLSFIDGIPLDLTSRLLPRITYFRPPLLTHIHLHSKFQERVSSGDARIDSTGSKKVTLNSLKGLTQSLRSAISSLKLEPGNTPWGDYYDTFSYSDETISHKEDLVREFIDKAKPTVVWDMGANTGRFSRIASSTGAYTISMDIDPGAVEDNYRQMVANSEETILPLVVDLTNPSPGLGWQLRERDNLIERGPVDAVLALALVHHLAIGNNLPLREIASFFARFSKWLLIEFVPKDDVQVQRMLSVREDIFEGYTKDAFETEFSEFFEFIGQSPLQDSSRTLYTLKNLRAL